MTSELDEARAEVERLKQKIARDLYDEAAVSDAVAEVCAEVEELKQVLATTEELEAATSEALANSQAEVERLRAFLLDLREQNSRRLREVHGFMDLVERLQVALAVFADEENWSEDYGASVEWVGKHNLPWTIAQEALSGGPVAPAPAPDEPTEA